MILANSDVGLYKFRGELIDSLLASGFEVVISLPDGEYIEALCKRGAGFWKRRLIAAVPTPCATPS